MAVDSKAGGRGGGGHDAELLGSGHNNKRGGGNVVLASVAVHLEGRQREESESRGEGYRQCAP
jgi:hypothetical protein